MCGTHSSPLPPHTSWGVPPVPNVGSATRPALANRQVANMSSCEGTKTPVSLWDFHGQLRLGPGTVDLKLFVG